MVGLWRFSIEQPLMAFQSLVSIPFSINNSFYSYQPEALTKPVISPEEGGTPCFVGEGCHLYVVIKQGNFDFVKF